MPAAAAAGPQHQLAVFIDFENIALGLKEGGPPFDVRRILDRLLEKGKVIVKVAYADWNRFRAYTTDLHENGIELIEIPRRASTGKNSADIRLVVDAMDLSWSKEHIDTFVIVSGDSDFSPLVSKLKENGRHVIGLGMKASTSPLLANGCDEFIYYEDLERGAPAPAAGAKPAGGRDEAFRLLVDTVRALQRENFEVLQASLVKDTMKRKRPAFSEAALGYGSLQRVAGGRAGGGPRHAAHRRAQRHLRGRPRRPRGGPRAPPCPRLSAPPRGSAAPAARASGARRPPSVPRRDRSSRRATGGPNRAARRASIAFHASGPHERRPA